MTEYDALEMIKLLEKILAELEAIRLATPGAIRPG